MISQTPQRWLPTAAHDRRGPIAAVAQAGAGPDLKDTTIDALLSRVPLAMWGTDEDLRVQWLRGGAGRMLGVDVSSAIGKRLDDLVGSEDLALIGRHRAALTGRTFSFESQWMDRWYEIWIEPLYSDGTITGTVAVALDITHTAIDTRAQVQIETDLREALWRGDLFLAYQPQVRLETSSVSGVEALLRWRKGNRVVPASAFIRQAEESSAMVPVGDWVIDTALAQMKRWRDRGLDPGRIAINVGARQLADDSIVETIRHALNRHEIHGRAVDLEITETAALHNVATTARLVDDLRSLGVAITIDDFGTGYSSLGYLKRFAVTGLKIDRSFVSEMVTCERAARIVKSVAATAGIFGMRLVAEGVETPYEAAMLRAIGCAEAQGFLYSRPLEADAMTGYLEFAGARGVRR